MHPIFTLFANRFIDKYGFSSSLKLATFFVIIGAWTRCFINYSYVYAIIGMVFLGIARPFVINS